LGRTTSSVSDTLGAGVAMPDSPLDHSTKTIYFTLNQLRCLFLLTIIRLIRRSKVNVKPYLCRREGATGKDFFIATSHFQSRRATYWKNLRSGGGCAAGSTWPPAGSAERDTCINQEMLKQVQHDKGRTVYKGGTVYIGGTVYKGRTVYKGGTVYKGRTVYIGGTVYKGRTVYKGGAVYKRGTVYLENIPDTVEINPKPLENIPNILKINPNTIEIIPNTLEIVSDTLEIIPNESKLIDFNNKHTSNTLFNDKFTEFCNKCKNILQMEAYHLTNKLHHYTHSRMAANCITLNTYLL
jgi:hypothetical protein